MRFVTAARGPRRLWVGRFAALLGVVCIALLLFTGILQVTHHHADGRIDPDCSLCMTAHQAIQVAAIVTAFVTSHSIARLTHERFDPLPRQRLVLKLAIRPPPVPAAFA